MTSKLVAVCCVRMNSERLPGKALSVYDEATGRPNIECIVERANTSRHNPNIVIATSDRGHDDAIEEWFRGYSTGKRNVFLYRGDLDNVVCRMDNAIKKFSGNSEYVWRLMADCPLVDIGIVDWKTDVLMRNHLDAMTSTNPEPTYAAQPSVWSRVAWDYCARMSSGSLLSHPGEYIWENSGQFRTISDPGPENVYYQNIRTELDTPEDLEFFRAVFREWRTDGNIQTIGSHTVKLCDSPNDVIPNTRMILSWLQTRPDIVALNSHVQEKTHSNNLHGHHRARNWRCQDPACNTVIAPKINDALEVKCPKCGTARRFYASPR